jgi:hypothetical protein
LFLFFYRLCKFFLAAIITIYFRLELFDTARFERENQLVTYFLKMFNQAIFFFGKLVYAIFNIINAANYSQAESLNYVPVITILKSLQPVLLICCVLAYRGNLLGKVFKSIIDKMGMSFRIRKINIIGNNCFTFCYILRINPFFVIRFLNYILLGSEYFCFCTLFQLFAVGIFTL